MFNRFLIRKSYNTYKAAKGFSSRATRKKPFKAFNFYQPYDLKPALTAGPDLIYGSAFIFAASSFFDAYKKINKNNSYSAATTILVLTDAATFFADFIRGCRFCVLIIKD